MQYEHCQLKFVKDISGFHSTHAIYIQIRVSYISRSVLGFPPPAPPPEFHEIN